MDTIVIRLATRDDAVAIAGLAAQLGYIVSENEVTDRFVELSRHTDHAIYVAASGKEVVG